MLNHKNKLKKRYIKHQTYVHPGHLCLIVLLKNHRTFKNLNNPLRLLTLARSRMLLISSIKNNQTERLDPKQQTFFFQDQKENFLSPVGLLISHNGVSINLMSRKEKRIRLHLIYLCSRAFPKRRQRLPGLASFSKYHYMYICTHIYIHRD